MEGFPKGETLPCRENEPTEGGVPHLKPDVESPHDKEQPSVKRKCPLGRVDGLQYHKKPGRTGGRRVRAGTGSRCPVKISTVI